MKKSMVLFTVLLMVFSIVSFSNNVMALTGEDILDEVDETLSSDSRNSTIAMTIVNSDGQERLRTITIKTKGDDKGLVKFLEPADVAGTSLLTVDQGDEDNMWLYLPAIGNVRKIASHMKNGSFMGTDFTYKDIDMVAGSNYKDDYNSTLKGEEKVNGDLCYKLETVPVNEDIEYSKMIMWVRKDDYIPLKMKFFDEDGEFLKVMENSNIKNIDGHLVPQKIVMENIQENTKTILALDEIEFDIEISDRVFTTRNLSR